MCYIRGFPYGFKRFARGYVGERVVLLPGRLFIRAPPPLRPEFEGTAGAGVLRRRAGDGRDGRAQCPQTHAPPVSNGYVSMFAPG